MKFTRCRTCGRPTMCDKTNATSAPPAALTSNDAATPTLAPVAVELIAALALSMPGSPRKRPARRAVLAAAYPAIANTGSLSVTVAPCVTLVT